MSLSFSLAIEGFKGGGESSGTGSGNCKVEKWLDELMPASEVALRVHSMNIHSFHGLGSWLLNLIFLQQPRKIGNRGLHSQFYREGN